MFKQWMILCVTFLALGGCAAHTVQRHQVSLALPETNSKAAEKYITQGEYYYNHGREAEARQQWQLAVELDPTRTDIQARLDQLRQGKGNITLAASHHANVSAKAISPDMEQRITTELENAEKLYRDSKLNEAQLSWQRVLLLDPGNVQGQSGLSRIAQEKYREDGNRPFEDMVKELYEEAMRAYRQKNWQITVSKLEEAMKLNPRQEQVKSILAIARSEHKKREINQTSMEWQMAADKAERTNDWLSAHQWWKKAWQLDPNDAICLSGVSRTAAALEPWVTERWQSGEKAFAQKAYAQALACYREIIAEFPEKTKVKDRIAQAEKQLQHSQADERSAADAEGWYNQGVASYRQGNVADACQAWEKAVAIFPEPEYVKWRDQARHDLKKQKDTNLEKAEKLYQDGLIAYQQGDLEQARRKWREVLKINPQHEKAAKNCQRLDQKFK